MFATALGWKTRKEVPRDEESKNAKLLIKAGFIEKIGSGIYSFLPLGLRVLSNIIVLTRTHMNAIGGAEVLMPALHPKEYWVKTGRWEKFNALFRLKSQYGPELGLGPTHEEIVVPLAQSIISSYKDLPLYLYQIQTKFRDEPRAKSGLLRAREFLMKDLYSFHASQDDLLKYYERVKKAYAAIAEDLELETYVTEASGGTFSKYSHEFQVPCETGEDTIFACISCGFSRNLEIVERNLISCPKCKGKKIEKRSAIETGNIFQLGTRFSGPFNLSFTDKNGKKNFVVMGCYGLGISRLLGALAEVKGDAKGLIWPKKVAPFAAYLINLGSKDKKVTKRLDGFAKEVLGRFQENGIETFVDDRELSVGEKFFDADLSGIPFRLVISEKNIKNKKIEIKYRSTGKIVLCDIGKASSLLR